MHISHISRGQYNSLALVHRSNLLGATLALAGLRRGTQESWPTAEQSLLDARGVVAASGTAFGDGVTGSGTPGTFLVLGTLGVCTRASEVCSTDTGAGGMYTFEGTGRLPAIPCCMVALSCAESTSSDVLRR